MQDQPSPAPLQVNLNVSDISDAVTVIDYAADQGAFRSWNTIRQVIVLRDKLQAFVTAANEATAKQEPVADDVQEPAVTVETHEAIAPVTETLPPSFLRRQTRQSR